MLQPKNTKFRKQQKMRNYGLAFKGSKLSFGDFGLQASTRGHITSKEIEAARRVISRHVLRDAKIWIRVFPDKPITKKPLEVRMGKGKGNVEYWVAKVKPGTMLYEIKGVSKAVAMEAMRKASAKLSVNTVFSEEVILW